MSQNISQDAEYCIVEIHASSDIVQFFGISAVINYTNEAFGFENIQEIIVMEFESNIKKTWHVIVKVTKTANFAIADAASCYVHKNVSDAISAMHNNYTASHYGLARFIVRHYYYLAEGNLSTMLHGYHMRMHSLVILKKHNLCRLHMLSEFIKRDENVIREITIKILDWIRNAPHGIEPKYFINDKDIETSLLASLSMFDVDQNLLVVDSDMDANMVGYNHYRIVLFRVTEKPSKQLISNIKVALYRKALVFVMTETTSDVCLIKESLNQISTN